MSGRFDMETAITEASQMARLTVEFIGRASASIGWTRLPLSREARDDLLQFAVLQTCLKCEEAERAFYGSKRDGII